ncbi:acyl-CoA dehydrogenase family protein [Rhizobium sp. BK538]|uniref:acyl-CoA dehydrogenase family protein n=1 Tax=Rhizobium sp. BK538 TaxID=2586984 RepID=UPI00161FBD5E|nr:acyl-CoA dehydrogenase family protein [Rhizobium sp. BK538]MBB4169006.1 glutaryl-CoA dehydrogenase [Rhizobium sp. BK538]
MTNALSLKPSTPKPLPVANGDFYDIEHTLKADEYEILMKVRAFMEEKVAPIINDYWVRDAFPFELLPALKQLDVGGVGIGRGTATPHLIGMLIMEMTRIDPSFATFFGVHTGLSMGSIALLGSEEQKEKWLPAMTAFDKIGCFGLTEPLVGSGTGGGLLTTAKRDGDTWILNGEKKWIGNATWCDISIIWARDIDDNQVKGFIVENKTTPGFSVEKIENKMALKVVQNGHITMKDCRIPEANRLQKANTFRDTAYVLRETRSGVGWMATGLQMGAFEAAVKYTQQRLQFGKPIASFQMVQDLIAKMYANLTACQSMMLRLAEIEASGRLEDKHASMAKAFATQRMRETVAWAREVHGGNGIIVDFNVGRLFSDAEALYSYEGTFQMQNLIVAKAATGFSAFV